MNKVFTFGVLFLLSMLTTVSFATNNAKRNAQLRDGSADLVAPNFSSADDSNENWYYIRFKRQATNNLVWTTDYPTNNASWGIKQLAQSESASGKLAQQWKLVGSAESFSIVNRATGFSVAYAAAEDAEKGIRGSNYVVGVDPSTYPAADLVLERSDANLDTYWANPPSLGWVIYNPSISIHAFINDRQTTTNYPWRDACYYYYMDAGDIIEFVDAVKQTIVVATDSVGIETLEGGHTGQAVFSGITNFNLDGAITATIEGPDAANFGFLNDVNTLPSGSGSLTITFTPQESRTYRATLVLNGGTAAPVSVILNGTAFSSELMPKISDENEEHWYFIQTYRRAAANTVWSLSDTTLMIVQDTLKPANIRDDQKWKIEGTWEDGYYFVNKAGYEMVYNETKSDDGTRPADRYLRAGLGYGDLFEFTRFRVSEGVYQDWQLLNRTFVNDKPTTTYKYLNDQQGRFLCQYVINDGGNRMVFIPADEPIIKSPTASLALEIPAGATVSSTISVLGLNLAGEITATITGADKDVFGFGEEGATLPGVGGKLTVTFNPVDVKSHSATLTLTSGTATLDIPLTGNSDLGLPIFNPTGNEGWYQISFNRNTTKAALAITAVPDALGNRYDTQVMQTPKDASNRDQSWKFVGNWTDGFQIINRNGGALSFDAINTQRFLLIEEEAFGDKFLFYRQNSTSNWQLNCVGKWADDDVDETYMNDWNGNAGDGSVSLYYVNDGGNTLIFTHVLEDAINAPAIDANDKVVSVKYYNLLGAQIQRPTKTGIYVVQNTYASGKVKAVKQLFIIK
ncbi:MAG: hypothetical protein LBR64_05605 [Dysgonamonadaceae bacterium]|jgi:hypothetical protein|nr:hypothetical protein [Dysgonamonadaceae bacterium]